MEQPYCVRVVIPGYDLITQKTGTLEAVLFAARGVAKELFVTIPEKKIANYDVTIEIRATPKE